MKLGASMVLWGACLLACSASAQLSISEKGLEAPGPTGLLKGMLLAPKVKPAAVVLIVPGSGPVDRDGNSPLGIQASTYRLLTQGLGPQNIATLRIDKRGLFASAPAAKDANAVTIADYVADVKSWVSVLRKETGAPCYLGSWAQRGWLGGHGIGIRSARCVRAVPGRDCRQADGRGLAGSTPSQSSQRPCVESSDDRDRCIGARSEGRYARLPSCAEASVQPVSTRFSDQRVFL